MAKPRSDAIFEGLFESLPDAVVIADADGRIQLINRMADQLFGYQPHELVGCPIEILLPERFHAAHTAHREAYANAPRTRPMGSGLDLLGRRKDGSEFPVEVSLSPLQTDVGMLVTAIVRDVTERKRLEQERARLLTEEQQARARLISILEATEEGIIFVDAATGHIRVNPQASRIFGRALVPERGVDQYASQVRAAYEGASGERLSRRALLGETVRSEEFLIIRPDGTQAPVLAQAAPVMGADGSVTGAVISFQDITVLKELEKLRDEWTSAIAHDLRQPVAAIGAYAQYLTSLGEGGGVPAAVSRTAENIRVATELLHRMIADLLDASRLASGHPGLEPFLADLALIAKGTVERLQRTTESHPLRLTIKGPLPRVEVDPPRIEQVLGNLIANAAKYGFPETEIHVEVTDDGDEIQVSVTNRGPGIAAHELPHLFQRFKRLAASRASDVQGLGLGLYISKQLVEAHGGHIWVESTPGEVTTFRFTGAMQAQEPGPPPVVTEEDEVLAQHTQLLRLAAWNPLTRQRDRVPVAPKPVAAGRAGPGALPRRVVASARASTDISVRPVVNLVWAMALFSVSRSSAAMCSPPLPHARVASILPTSSRLIVLTCPSA
ncbi:MAG: sensory box histidine kinase [Chloroflexi bacterium]|nr:sensory box histidine kinase [Chloroflexota bacterium]